MKKLLILLLLVPTGIFAQTLAPLILRGTVTLKGNAAEGVTLELTKNGKKINTFLTPASGKYSMETVQSTTDKQSEYILTVTKEGTAAKNYRINTYVPKTYYIDGTAFHDLDISLIATSVKDAIVPFPSEKIKWIPEEKVFNKDKDYAKTIFVENGKILFNPDKYFGELKQKEDEINNKKLKAIADSISAYDMANTGKIKKEKEAARAKAIADSTAKSKLEAERIRNEPRFPVKKIRYEGKLLMGGKEKEPLMNQKVNLMDDKKVEVQTSVTDKYGDFSFKDVSTNKTYTIEVPDNGQKIKDGQLFLAKQDGTIINSLKKSGKSFVYELLPTELNTIAKVNEEDPSLKIMNFSSSKQTELTVIENIYYAPNSAEINKEALVKLDKIINAMQKTKTIKLVIASHTDSKGDDASNMALSEKRAQKVLDYFLAKGINKERLSSKGFGETQIKNRCKNGVDCSEKELELNRRTEFKFSK